MNQSITRIFFVFMVVFSLVYARDSSARSISDLKEEDLLVLKGWKRWEDERPTLRHYLNVLLNEQLDARAAEVAKLRSQRAWKRRIERSRERYREILGEMPERTPLNARITGTETLEFCRIEKVLFESRPEQYVTACMFLPDGIDAPRPAVLFVCGHSELGYRYPSYQYVILNLVQQGFVVFAMDPIGQGERLMYYDAEKKASRVGGPTTEHSYVGKQCFLGGVSPASYFVWDMVRALDYMESRPEIDPARMAVHGRSGGGTQSALLMAYDDRVAIGAPENYITNFRRLHESADAQDAEQCLFRGIAWGLDHADFITMRAPKPVLQIATYNDFFSIAGVYETMEEARRAYIAFDAEDCLALAVDEGGHASTEKNRVAFYQFLRKHFEFPGDSSDTPFDPLPNERLNVTPTGQVLDSFGGKTVFDFNQEYCRKLVERLHQQRQAPDAFRKTMTKLVPELSGYHRAGEKVEHPLLIARHPMEGYAVEEWVVPWERYLDIPLLLAIPNAINKAPVVMLFHQEGKAATYQHLEQWVRQGWIVLSADLAGIGETAGGNHEYQDPYTALMLGTSVPGIRASQITHLLDFVSPLSVVDASRIMAVGFGSAGNATLLAAASDRRISRLAVVDALESFERIVQNRYYQFDSGDLIAGALTVFDLPDLAGMVAPREILILNARDHNHRPIPESETQSDYAFARNCFELEKASDRIHIVQIPDEQRDERLKAWLFTE